MIHRTRRAILPASLFIALAAAACSRTPSEPTSPTPSNAPATDPHASVPPGRGDQAGTPIPAMPRSQPAMAHLTWDDPPGWQRETPASPMRRAQYRIPHVGAETNDAELVVITFGAGQGGDNDANLERWYGQVTQADGRPTREIATRHTFTVGSMQVIETEATGRLGATGMAMPGAPPAAPIEHGRLLAAIVDSGQGPWFFKITGPDATVAAARPAFEAMLRSIRTGG